MVYKLINLLYFLFRFQFAELLVNSRKKIWKTSSFMYHLTNRNQCKKTWRRKSILNWFSYKPGIGSEWARIWTNLKFMWTVTNYKCVVDRFISKKCITVFLNKLLMNGLPLPPSRGPWGNSGLLTYNNNALINSILLYLIIQNDWTLPLYIYYRPFHKTLPRSSLFVNWIPVRFYETGCRWNQRAYSI